MTSRRDLLKALPACLAGAAIMPPELALAETTNHAVSLSPHKPVYRPLEKLTVRAAGTPGRIIVSDGDGREYAHSGHSGEFEFTVGGALGSHRIAVLDHDGRIAGSVCFQVNCETAVEDDGGYYQRLLDMLRWTMESWEGDAPVRAARFNDKTYYFFVGWLRDHTHTMKGMKYFWPELKSAVDLYADTQREDGMVFDNIYRRSSDYNYWDWILTPGKFLRVSRDGRWEMHRQPVEADVEYLFVEAVYYTWKATGDDAWMAAKLDHAARAIQYSITDEYRWSSKYQLIKRAYTIDTWDFVPEMDQIGGQNQVIDPQKSRFGVMFGDNTGTIVSCRYLAEMFDHVGRRDDAIRYRTLAGELQQRLDQVAWNGEFYRHHVAEDLLVRRDLGVDEARQVSLSNAYSLNRGITHAQAAAIIRTYQRIRQEMPRSSPGEFYAIYPPYGKGFDKDNVQWEYMNAGVLSIVAGELAHGAFEHGFEEYGVDILRRQKEVAEKHNGFLPVVLRGKTPDPPPQKFATANLRELVNVDFGAGGPTVPGWLSEANNNLENMPVGRQVFHGIPFEVVDPATNGRKACLGLGWSRGYANTAPVKLDRRATSVYLLHAGSRAETTYGCMRLRYSDGETAPIYVDENTLGTWWEPADRRGARVAWHGPNQQFGNVGVYVSGYANPYPEKTITAIEFEPLQNGAKWMVLGLTLSDCPVYFPPKDDVSFGIPDGWGAAAVVYALVEGLAGIKDTGTSYDHVQISPRWSAARVAGVRTTVRYPASRGYVDYEYAYDAPHNLLKMRVTGNAQRFQMKILLPPSTTARQVKVNAAPVDFGREMMEKSSYVTFALTDAVNEVELLL